MDNSLNGFDVFTSLMPGMEPNKNSDLGVGEELTDEELEALRKPKKTEEIEEIEEKSEIGEEEELEDEEDIEEDPEEDPEPPKKIKTNKKVNKQEEDLEPEQDNESVMVTGFFDSISEKLGWEDIEDNDKPKSVDDLINYFSAVIEENSTPDYASEEVQKLDEFVRNGGDIRKYFEIDAPLDLETVDVEDNESDQKAVIKEFLKEKGFSQKSIEKKLAKYEDAGILEDEAMDALESLKEIRETKKEQLLKYQQKKAEEAKEQQRQLYNNVVNSIKGLDTIRGIKVPDKDKRALIDYILKPDTDGQTRYYKDYVKGGVKNLIESAYFTMNADKLISAAEQKGRSKAIDRFKNSLKTTSVTSKRVNRNEFENDDNSIWSSAIRQLRMS